jgi:poly(A) polymerase
MDLGILRAKLEEIGLPFELFGNGGSRVYLVGGCIRDAILKREITDFDFAVEGSGVEYARLFSEKLGATFVPLKLDEGRVVYRKTWTFDFSGLGGHEIEKDLWERDFTINAMAIELWHLLRGEWRLMDPTSGAKDLRSKRIRMTSEQSMVEDPLRILRTFRFASQLDFAIDVDTRKAVRRHKRLLTVVAGERIWHELSLILQTGRSWRWVEEMGESGVLSVLLPEFDAMRTYPELDLMHHSILSLKELEAILSGERITVFGGMERELRRYFNWRQRKPLLKLATLLHDIGKPPTFSADEKGGIHFYGHDTLGQELLSPILKERLRMSRREIDTITRLVRYHMRPHLLGREMELTQRAMRRFFTDLGEEWLGVILLAFADALATGNGGVSQLEHLTSQLVSFRKKEEKKGKVERLIGGTDLIDELHLQPGPLFRHILERVEEEQLEGAIRSREEALDLVRKILEEGGQ